MSYFDKLYECNFDISGRGKRSDSVMKRNMKKYSVIKRIIYIILIISCIIIGIYSYYGGDGTVKDAISAIGFSIYQTEEMENLILWMREYNKSATQGNDIRFYGFDMQRREYTYKYLLEAVKDAGIAQVLLNEPKLIVLDEPTAGLDPKERVRFRHIFEELGKDNIVLLSTNIVSKEKIYGIQ